MPREIVAKGAEAVLYLEKGTGRKEAVLVKDRIPKGYRLPALDDRIRKGRTKREVKMLERASRAGVPVPVIRSTENTGICMDFIQGRTVKESFNSLPVKERVRVSKEIGRVAALLHGNGMVHGDLTTSNMILSSGRKRLYLIDFGLGRFSQKVEDQAVDLFLLYEALKAAHYKYLNEVWQNILKIYRQDYSGAPGVLRRFEKISRRRRYK